MLKKKKISDSLLKWNYFPIQKKNREEIPPVFNSSSFNEGVATLLCNTKSRLGGYDQVEYRATRFNNVPRSLSIPHPQPYAKLCLEIQSNWNVISTIEGNQSSIIRPHPHKDGRIIIMDYESSQRSSHRHLNKSLGMRFLVHTDISNFFNSIYTHAIPWALVGFDQAKKNKQAHGEWYNKLDKYQRQCKRDETMGVPIGPATSNVFAELILQRIDEKLRNMNFSFIRYIDDYTAYCSSNEQAEDFILKLSQELKRYKLTLNLKKTHILQLPEAISVDWVADLSTRCPKSKKINCHDVIRYLDYALSIQRKTPDGSVLKFAVKTISSKVDTAAKLSLAKYALSLAFHYPVIIPLLDKLIIGLHRTDGFNLEGKLLKLLTESIRASRSDGISWSLYLLKKHCTARVSDSIANQIVATADCFSITMLYLLGGHEEKVITFASQITRQDLFAIDAQWLLLYQLFFDGKISNPYSNSALYSDLRGGRENEVDAMRREIQCFEILKRKNVSFINTSYLRQASKMSFKALLLKLAFTRIRKNIGI
ncbi:antiviral reverse transcriptase Drt4 [Microbulbifer sp. 2304DJ12-6]|uniref:antiviral reverse transcriptase Drt4 n=1 Tax=Microbulbifer sp. 2304DJ12-6 TaxID=3233340 RepID=UPI0039AEC845